MSSAPKFVFGDGNFSDSSVETTLDYSKMLLSNPQTHNLTLQTLESLLNNRPSTNQQQHHHRSSSSSPPTSSFSALIPSPAPTPIIGSSGTGIDSSILSSNQKSFDNYIYPILPNQKHHNDTSGIMHFHSQIKLESSSNEKFDRPSFFDSLSQQKSSFGSLNQLSNTSGQKCNFTIDTIIHNDNNNNNNNNITNSKLKPKFSLKYESSGSSGNDFLGNGESNGNGLNFNSRHIGNNTMGNNIGNNGNSTGLDNQDNEIESSHHRNNNNHHNHSHNNHNNNHSHHSHSHNNHNHNHNNINNNNMNSNINGHINNNNNIGNNNIGNISNHQNNSDNHSIQLTTTKRLPQFSPDSNERNQSDYSNSFEGSQNHHFPPPSSYHGLITPVVGGHGGGNNQSSDFSIMSMSNPANVFSSNQSSSSSSSLPHYPSNFHDTEYFVPRHHNPRHSSSSSSSLPPSSSIPPSSSVSSSSHNSTFGSYPYPSQSSFFSPFQEPSLHSSFNPIDSTHLHLHHPHPSHPHHLSHQIQNVLTDDNSHSHSHSHSSSSLLNPSNQYLETNHHNHNHHNLNHNHNHHNLINHISDSVNSFSNPHSINLLTANHPPPLHNSAIFPSLSLNHFGIIPYHQMGPHTRAYLQQLNETIGDVAHQQLRPANYMRELPNPSTILPDPHSRPPSTHSGPPKVKDTANRTTRRFCHVCRSPKDISKIVRCSSGKQSHVFCSSCVQRRLGLVFETLITTPDWLCPKCENRCPCSKCRKRTENSNYIPPE